ncbi:hypothetical protein Bca52824_081609 [Brassica carinata]|uniref:Uncharacterized protein n=1 Tax=Brassica carinata TaxID=52824 RepID=A0A8X7PI62_BRACI|nr:hypothetical protein Bca52824_081609 [Brassica carinata]
MEAATGPQAAVAGKWGLLQHRRLLSQLSLVAAVCRRNQTGRFAGCCRGMWRLQPIRRLLLAAVGQNRVFFTILPLYF